MSRTNDAANGATEAQSVNKAAEIGWTFVPQYYTCMNQDPSRLHHFYTKKSTMVHAEEKEDAQPCFGQQEIHERLQALDLDGSKVYVSTVDSQASADGGILIQVLGEQSSQGENWRKFSQTFFLAQQPNGYYVLNDIFRYLADEDEAQTEAAADEPVTAPAPPAEQPVAPSAEQPMAPSSEDARQPERAPEPAKEQPAQKDTRDASAPKTWANLAATGSKAWSTPSTPSAAPSPVPSPAPSAPAQPKAPRSASNQIFVKNVQSEHAQNDALKNALESQFGATKECQVNAAKGFAFVEFTNADAARRAVAAQTLRVGTATVQLEKRRVNERGSTTSRGRGRGRGGAHA